jgi:general secretion pathway protein E
MNQNFTLEQQIQKDPLIIECKKEAKKLLHENKLTQPNLTLMFWQNHIAKFKGFLDWHNLYQVIKNKYNQPEQALSFLGNNIIHQMIVEALINDASNIHFSITPDKDISIRQRLHGELIAIQHPQISYTTVTNDFLQFCKVIDPKFNSSINILNIDKNSIHIQGQYELSPTLSVSVRIQTINTYPNGYDLTISVKAQPISYKTPTLEHLGYSVDQAQLLRNIANIPVGLTIIGGATGAGSTTTMNSLLTNTIEYINSIQKTPCKAFSLESPIENKLPGVTQLEISNNTEDIFKIPMLSVLKQDPDLIFLSELRDSNTAKHILKAVQSGHEVFTVVHGSSAFGIIDRLHSFGLSYEALSSPHFLSSISYQQLIPLTCPNCSISLQDTMHNSIANASHKTIWKKISNVYPNISKTNIKLKGKGCSSCKNGRVGRTACAEVVQIDKNILKHIKEGNILKARQYWHNLSNKNPLSNNMTGKSAKEHGIYKVFNGLICIEDFEYYFGLIEHN